MLLMRSLVESLTRYQYRYGVSNYIPLEMHGEVLWAACAQLQVLTLDV